MHLKKYRRLGLSAAAVMIAGVPVVSGSVRPAHAAGDVTALVTTAIHNTDTVNTLIHQDSRTLKARGGTLVFHGRGTEDEIHNREQDYESVSVKSKTAAGKVQSLHYTADIIFLNGMTYARISLNQNKWVSRKGSKFADPYTGGWQRGRTTVAFPKSTSKFQQVSVSGGQTQVHATFAGTGVAGTVDLWISGGATPYVVRQLMTEHSAKGPAASEQLDIRYGPFNVPVVIVAPAKQGST